MVWHTGGRFTRIIRICLGTILLLGHGGMLAQKAQSKAQGNAQKSEEKQKSSIERQIEALTSEKKQVQSKEDLEPLLKDISQQIASVETELQDAQGESTTFLQIKLATLQKWYQDVAELAQTRRRIISTLEEHIQLLTSIQERARKQQDEPTVATVTNYDTLREYAQKLQDTQQELASLRKKKASRASELDHRKHVLTDLDNEYTRKQKLQQSLASQTATQQQLDEQLQGLRVSHQGEIIDLQLKHLRYKRQLAQAYIQEHQASIALMETKIEQANKDLTRLRNQYDIVKERLRIDADYMDQAKARFEKQQDELIAQQTKLNERWQALRAQAEELSNQINTFAANNNVSKEDFEAYRQWNKQPESQQEWQTVAELGQLITKHRHIQQQQQLAHAQFDQEGYNLQQERINFNILNTWYRIKRPVEPGEAQMKIKEEFQRELQEYQHQRKHLDAKRAILRDDYEDAMKMLRQSSSSLTALKEMRSKAEEQAEKLFTDQQAYRQLLETLKRAEANLRRQIETTARLVEVYSTSIATIEESIARLDNIIGELDKRYFWRRSEQSIEWEELWRFWDNFTQFAYEVYGKTLPQLANVDITYIPNRLLSIAQQPMQLLILILQVLLWMLGYLCLRRYLPIGANMLVGYESQYTVINMLLGFLAIIMRFVRRYLTSLYLWWTGLLIITYFAVVSIPIAMIFYLLSIPYGIYIAHAFFEYVMKVNRERGYIFVSQDYQSRFFLIIPALTYATITLTLLRQAIWLSGKSDYQVLLALNFILLQIALICLVSREHILSLVSDGTPMWKWVEEHVDRYYYVLLLAVITVIVMSNPFVGLGYPVIYYVSRIVLTLLLIPLCSWLHDRLKRSTSDLFFYYAEGEVIKERFPGGKSWYGLFVIGSFFAIALAGLMVAAYIWGQPIAWSTITDWFQMPMYWRYDPVTGKQEAVKIFALLYVFMFIAGGVLTAHIINRFVLQRIFDPLMIGAGVQNTIITLTRYAILALSLLFGLQYAGLVETLGYYLILLLGGFAYVMKEPIGDFISYFIILVQRPIKVGDFIRMEPNILGVVRQINPRSTVIRYRNSTTFVVPNSDIITKTVQNWHYTRTFSAFEDILITVSYEADPERVRNIIFEILDENTNVLRNPRPIVRLEHFLDNGFQFRIRGFITADKILDLYDIAGQVRMTIVKRLREEHIPIAVPTRVLREHQPYMAEGEDALTNSSDRQEHGSESSQ